MNLTYLAITGGIVLATMLVYALLSWRREPQQPQADAEPASVPAVAPRHRRGVVPAAHPSSGESGHDPA